MKDRIRRFLKSENDKSPSGHSALLVVIAFSYLAIYLLFG